MGVGTVPTSASLVKLKLEEPIQQCSRAAHGPTMYICTHAVFALAPRLRALTKDAAIERGNSEDDEFTRDTPPYAVLSYT